MTQKDKELLLKDLCARLPYGVKCQFEDTIETIKEIWFCEDNSWQVDGEKTSTCIYGVKPYLFPLSSITEEQEKELEEIDPEFYSLIRENGDICVSMDIRGYDWLNKNHFDYRGLISMGLVIDATGLNIY